MPPCANDAAITALSAIGSNKGASGVSVHRAIAAAKVDFPFALAMLRAALPSQSKAPLRKAALPIQQFERLASIAPLSDGQVAFNVVNDVHLLTYQTT